MRPKPPGRIVLALESRALAPGLVACVAFSAIGEAIVRGLGFSYGGGLVGFFLFAAALGGRLIPLERVETGTSLAVSHLAFPLVGVTASVVFETRSLAEGGAALLVATAASSIGVLSFVGLVAQAWLSRRPRA
jgi:putative effector of murein hydrolase LrgA (UPF0299 family)